MKKLNAATRTPEADDQRVRTTVEEMLSTIERGGEEAVRQYARDLDGWTGDIVLSDTAKRSLIDSVSDADKADLAFAYRQVRAFAAAQRNSLQPFEIETEPGVRLGQRIVPMQCAGCYVPSGRYAHAA